MKILWLLVLTALPLSAQLGPLHTSMGRNKSDANNFTTDLIGVPDSRPDTWGDAASMSWQIVFHPPTGYRVRILRLRGDLTAAVKVLPTDTPLTSGQQAWVLIGAQTTGAEGSTQCTPCADNTMLYHQLALDSHPGGVMFDEDVSAGGLLLRDNILVIVTAVFLNTTGKLVHIEPTFSGITYQYEKIPPEGATQ